MQHLRDEDVMLNYQKGEIPAMDELLRRYRNPIYHFAYRLLSDRAEAEDIAQEVFLRLHQQKDAYAPSGKFSTWIFGIAHHLCISRLRKKKWLCIWPRDEQNGDQLVEFPSPNPSPQDSASSSELAQIISRLIQGLPFLQREALILREYQDLDYQEISTILKKPQGTVKTLIHRARQNLKIKLLPFLGETQGGI